MSISSKERLEEALVKAVHRVVVEHVVKEYMAHTPNPTMDDLPMLEARVRELWK